MFLLDYGNSTFFIKNWKILKYFWVEKQQRKLF